MVGVEEQGGARGGGGEGGCVEGFVSVGGGIDGIVIDRLLDIDGVVMMRLGLESGVVIETVSRSWCLSMRGMLCSAGNYLRHVESPGPAAMSCF